MAVWDAAPCRPAARAAHTARRSARPTRPHRAARRYRVVDVGCSPYDESLTVLGEAKRLLETHARVAPGTDLPVDFRTQWAREIAEVQQGLGVTHLLYRMGRDEDDRIEALLQEALELRVTGAMRMSEAETRNSLGLLRQKQKRYDDARAFYARSLEIREALDDVDIAADHSFASFKEEDEVKVRCQVTAQSLVSLGNLAIEQAEGEKERGQHEAAKRFYSEARVHMESAQQAYTRGFHATHPKVAWATEGLAKVLMHEGQQRQALKEFEKAVSIRRSLHTTHTEKEFFTRELQELEANFRHRVVLARLQSASTSRRSSRASNASDTVHAFQKGRRGSKGSSSPEGGLANWSPMGQREARLERQMSTTSLASIHSGNEDEVGTSGGTTMIGTLRAPPRIMPSAIQRGGASVPEELP